jgi:hypothetical protein
VLDGTDVAPAATSLTLRAKPGRASELALTIRVDKVDVDGGLRVVVDDATRELLTSAGWTPPAEAAGLASDEPAGDQAEDLAEDGGERG